MIDNKLKITKHIGNIDKKLKEYILLAKII